MDMEITWLDNTLKLNIKKVFEPRYKRQLSDLEIKQIAVNLTSYIENAFRFIKKMQYEKF